MNPSLERCLQTLRALASTGDVNRIALAENAINEYVALHQTPDTQTEALNMLQNAFDAVDYPPGPQREFVNTVEQIIRDRSKRRP